MAKLIYNDLSKEYKEKTRWGTPLGIDEVAEFQLISIPEIKQNGVLLPFYAYRRIPNVDAVYDPFHKGGARMKEIAYVLNETGNEAKPYNMGEIEFTKANKNVISISGREYNKMGLLYFLRASNLNQSNPLAVMPPQGYLFRELEPKKTAGQKLKDRLDLNTCVTYIDEMKESEIVTILKALKQQTFVSLEENKLALVDFVQIKANRDKFNGLSKDARLPVAALITKAEELEILRYTKDTKVWSYVDTGNPITQVQPQTDRYEHLLDYFHNNKHGKAVKDFIEKQIEAINAEKAKNSAEKVALETKK